MLLFPYRRFRLESPLPPEVVASRLAAAVEPVGWVKWLWGMPERPFEGEAGPTEFRVRRVIWHWNDLRPVVEGRVVRTPGGSAVEGTMAPRPFAAVFMTVWLGFAGLLAVPFGLLLVSDGLNGQWRPELLGPVGVFAVGWVIFVGSFALESWRALALLREIAGIETGRS